MKTKIIITSAIFASLFLSACETASQKVVSGSAASKHQILDLLLVQLIKRRVCLLKLNKQLLIN